MMNFCFEIQPERTKIKTRLDETIHCLSYFALLERFSFVGYWAQSLKGSVVHVVFIIEVPTLIKFPFVSKYPPVKIF